MNDQNFFLLMIFFPVISMIICFGLILSLKIKKWLFFGITTLLTLSFLIQINYFNPNTVDNRYGLGYVLPGLTVDVPFILLIGVLIFTKIYQNHSK